MAVTSRPWRDGDLALLVELASDLWGRDRRAARHNFGELAWWRSRLGRDGWSARLWLEGEKLVGWGWLEGGELEWQAPVELLDEILDWARPSSTALWSWEERAAATLAAYGFREAPGAPWFRLNGRSLASLEEPVLPPGYRLRTLADDIDPAARAELHRAVWHPSRVTDEIFADVQAHWPYRPELDCVVESAEGELVAYTLAWLDEANAVGELEPVGTHPAHRRLGLGRAVNLLALERLRAAGAREAIVFCRGDDGRPIPRRLYESVGFVEVARCVPFVRA